MNDAQIEAQKKKVDEWNREWERGQRVLVGSTIQHKEYEAIAVTQAYVYHGMAVVYLNNDIEVPVEIIKAMVPCVHCHHLITEPFPFENGEGQAVCDDCGRERNMH
jgi:hypothetical protein